MKDKLNELPQIDAQFQHNKSVEYASKLMDDLLVFYTLDQISLHAGISRRSLGYMRHTGIQRFPVQLSLEILAERWKVSLRP